MFLICSRLRAPASGDVGTCSPAVEPVPCVYPVTAPVDADDTSRAYFANTPVVYRGAGAVQVASRSVISSSLNSTSS